MRQVARKMKTQLDGEFRHANKSDVVAIENAVREMGRMEEVKRRYLEEQ
ncbi:MULTISPECIES: hypothetical protein [unclassified Ruegeria]|nr:MULTISPECIES: hypothetical protein [unclassified Ruegeria]NOD90582.1 hypothetical protein [Ruegeria sp. HKCCD4318]NOE15915.1 hypothetical protein [Ruegeria sp. HKCCD4318-2]NOG10807.1 hypothetical protein [Ruegeria sp. HKCCD4315]